MRIASVGAGPAGLTLAALAAADGHDVQVHERRSGLMNGLGVVLWPDYLEGLGARDPQLVQRLLENAVEWNDQIIEVDGRDEVRLPGQGHGIARATLLRILLERAEERGARVVFDSPVTTSEQLPDAAVVVAADGAGSAVRSEQQAVFGSTADTGRNRYAWYELTRPSDAFAFPFARMRTGWAWAHVYPFQPGSTTFIVEMTDAVWRSEGFERLDVEQTTARLERLFAGQLQGGRLVPTLTGAAQPLWLSFRLVTNTRWTDGRRVVLIGDAAHTTHFSIGSGTRLAMEDAAALVEVLREAEDVPAALECYSAERVAALREIQLDAELSTRFFERLPRYVDRPARDFVRLVERRRSRSLPHLPVPLYLTLSRTADRLRGSHPDW